MASFVRFLTWCKQAQSFQDVWWNLVRVKLWLEELRIDIKRLFSALLDVFEHAEGELPFHFL